ncbi:MAG: hypothetical protein ACPG61_10230 [Paracoccaceae bacterium]
MFDLDDTNAADLAHARGIMADCCHHPDPVVIAACETIIAMADPQSCEARRATRMRHLLTPDQGHHRP